MLSIVGVLADDTDPLVSVMKVDKAPLETYADIGGLESQIQEIKEAGAFLHGLSSIPSYSACVNLQTSLIIPFSCRLLSAQND